MERNVDRDQAGSPLSSRGRSARNSAGPAEWAGRTEDQCGIGLAAGAVTVSISGIWKTAAGHGLRALGENYERLRASEWDE